MSPKLAYHVVVNAIEARSGWTPTSRFASTIAHVIDGHLPYERYRRSGSELRPDGPAKGDLQRLIAEWLAIDLNPFVQIFSALKRKSSVVDFYNLYNASALLGVRASVSLLSEDGALEMMRDVRIEDPDTVPELCRHGAAMMVGELLALNVRANSAGGHQSPSLSKAAEALGLSGTVAAEACMVFECEGHVGISELATKLGCHRRTLERGLRSMGLKAESLRQASMLVKVARRLGSEDSLTVIAADEGFFDLSHMARAFRKSCRMLPSACQALARADAKAEAGDLVLDLQACRQGSQGGDHGPDRISGFRPGQLPSRTLRRWPAVHGEDAGPNR